MKFDRKSAKYKKWGSQEPKRSIIREGEKTKLKKQGV
jgi:hypothetical protein